MKFKEHFKEVLDGLDLSYRELKIDYNGDLILKTVGCNCCTYNEIVNMENVHKAIKETEHFLKHLKELEDRIKKNKSLPKNKIVFD